MSARRALVQCFAIAVRVILTCDVEQVEEHRIEKVMAEVNKCENQLVQATVSELEFNVWRVDYDDSDGKFDDDDSEASDDSHDNTDVDMTERDPDVVTVTVTGKEASDRGTLSQSHAKLCRSKAYGPSDCNLFKLFGQ
jgi:hypothetical protein